MTTAKLFWNGNSQVVCLPKEFRFSGSLVNIRKQGRQVIIEPIENDREQPVRLGTMLSNIGQEIGGVEWQNVRDKNTDSGLYCSNCKVSQFSSCNTRYQSIYSG